MSMQKLTAITTRLHQTSMQKTRTQNQMLKKIEHYFKKMLKKNSKRFQRLGAISFPPSPPCRRFPYKSGDPCTIQGRYNHTRYELCLAPRPFAHREGQPRHVPVLRCKPGIEQSQRTQSTKVGQSAVVLEVAFREGDINCEIIALRKCEIIIFYIDIQCWWPERYFYQLFLFLR